VQTEVAAVKPLSASPPLTVHPCSMRQRLVAIAEGAPITRMFDMISPTSHHEQWGRASFKINGKERRFLAQLAEDQKSKVSDLAPRHLYHRDSEELTPGIVHGVLGALAFSPSKPRNAPLTMNGDRARTSITSILPAW
jgi:hypothetical protein